MPNSIDFYKGIFLNVIPVRIIVPWSEAKYKTIHGEEVKILTHKQILQKLPIALAQVKAGNTSENLLNEIRQIINSLYRLKEITKKSIQQYNKFNTDIIWNGYKMDSKNSKTSYPHRLMLTLSDKLNLKMSDKYFTSSDLNIYYTWKRKKINIEKMNLKCTFLRGMINFDYLMDHILYLIFNITWVNH